MLRMLGELRIDLLLHLGCGHPAWEGAVRGLTQASGEWRVCNATGSQGEKTTPLLSVDRDTPH
jgi:hypothetical protein